MIQPGTLIEGKYRVERQLGEGGMATVYEATHVNLGERVAIKVLLNGLAGEPTVVERFMREARAAAKLRSDHVVRVIDVGSLPSQLPYIVMEFLDGKDLEGLLKDRGRLPAGETADYVLQVCVALAEAHGSGIVHRDIKPANLVLAKRADGQPMIKVLDFGIAKLTLADAGPKLTATSATMGTPAFMSPEQIRGAKDVDHRTDIWALGITLFELLTGSVPFYANTYAKLVMTITRDPTPDVAHIPPGLNAVIQRCLAKDRTQRYQNIAELAQELEQFAGDRGEATLIVQRCIGLVRAQQVRTGTPAVAAQAHASPSYPQGAPGVPTAQPPGYGMPPGQLNPMSTPPQGMNPMATPAHGMQPMHPLGTPAQGMPPGHQVNPMLTPAQGMHPMNPMTTPAQGMPPHVGAPYAPQHDAPGMYPSSHATGPHLPTHHATGPHLPATNVPAPTSSKSSLLWLVMVVIVIGGAVAAAILVR